MIDLIVLPAIHRVIPVMSALCFARDCCKLRCEKLASVPILSQCNNQQNDFLAIALSAWVWLDLLVGCFRELHLDGMHWPIRDVAL